jgi:hypothetical protein
MPEYRIKSSSYYCQKVKSRVEVSNKYLIHRNSRTGEIDKETLVEFECDTSDECDVFENAENSKIPNWKKCIHPLSPS